MRAPFPSDPVAQAVADCVSHRGAFTAWTITQTLRVGGLPLPHASVRTRVHALYAAGSMGNSYRRTFLPVDDRASAWVYHPHDTPPTAG